MNFVSGGAGALAGTNQGLKQLRQKLGASELKALLSTAVYMFSIGYNDYLIPFITNSTVFPSYSKKEYVKMVIGNITSVIQEIYNMGGRKFGLSKLLPLGCPPISRALKIVSSDGSGCMEEITVLAKLHNRALPQALKELKSQLKGYTYSIFDAYTAADAIFE
ncbi:hypothetical protein SADUNF_Sadunf17G0123800 [Salix dunnii]|uniref:Uncharacterized protein n=1 Tax=Salix dunnii TaxID=1413687 RepID=A0A835J6W9_9ROSI|nr:hypothetical protein SADUNF_Sadunf17G0123800 [Salix dunnii]